MMKKFTLIILFISLSFCLRAQDFHYSQFYAAPLYLNPAMTGSTELSRVGLNYRKQWPGLSQDFNAYSAYFDHYSFDLKSGFGVAVHSFYESNMSINTTDVSLLYSYKLKLADSWALRFGGQAAWVRRDAKLDNMIFGDQVNLFTRSIDMTTIDQTPDIEPYSYLDISFGALLNSDFFWLGGSAHHVNRPSLSFFPDNDFAVLPMKYSVHGGINFPLGSNGYYGSAYDNQASIVFNYKKQGPFQQFDLGTQVYYKTLISGIGYRGIPGVRKMPNQDSIILSLGLKLENDIVLGYSFDFMISNIGMQTKGSHEISMRYTFFQGTPNSRNQRSRVLNCFNYLM